jgi:hypothetical protein
MFHETWRMEKMFKKTLLALAIAGTAFNAAATLTVDANGSGTGTTSAQLISAEGAASSTSVDLLDINVDVSDNTDYGTVSKIKVTITGGTLTPSTDATFLLDAADLTANSTITYPDTKTVLLTLGGADVGTAQGVADNQDIIIGGLSVALDSKVAGSKVTYKVDTISSVGGAVIETVTGDVASVVTQFGASVTTKLGLKDIDVGDGRLSFDGAVKTDSLAVTATSALVDLLAADATAEKATTVLTGSFGFLDTNADGKVTAADAGTTTATINTAFTTATVVGAATGFDGAAADTSAVTTTFTVDGKTQVLVPQTFSVDVEFDYADAEAKDATFAKTLTGGAWTLNGDSAFIPFMPFSSAFAQSITVTNSGTVAGTITVDITANGDTKSHTLTAVAGAEMVTNITGEVIAFAKADGVTGNAAINVVTNSPSDDISVSALYYSKADKDRGIVSVVNK